MRRTRILRSFRILRSQSDACVQLNANSNTSLGIHVSFLRSGLPISLFKLWYKLAGDSGLTNLLHLLQHLVISLGPPMMQHPTLQNVRIRSTRDALQVFHGVATRRLPLITRRLDAEERRNIVPGNVYVWYVQQCRYEAICLLRQPLYREERGANTEPTGLGMERW